MAGAAASGVSIWILPWLGMIASARGETPHPRPLHPPTGLANLVEVWFSISDKQTIHRGNFNSVRDLMSQIRAFIKGWNTLCYSFNWMNPSNRHR